MRHLSLRMKLTTAFIIIAVIEGILIGSFSYFHSKDLVVKNKKQEMSDTINRLDININERVRYLIEMLDQASDNETVQEACFAGAAGNYAGFAMLADYIDKMLLSSREQMEISLITRQEVIYTTCPDRITSSQKITSDSLNIYYQAVGSRRKTAWAGIMKPLFSDSAIPQDCITVAKVIESPADDRVLGIMILELEPAVFSELLMGNQGLFQYQYLSIADGEGRMIASNPKIDNGWQKEINERFKTGTRRFDLIWNGRQYYVCGQYNGLTGWNTYTVIPQEGLFPQAKELRNFIWLAVIICTALIAAVTALLVYTLARPIKRLSQAMDQVQQGDFTVQIANKRKDEIGGLTDSFNYMADTINTLIRQVYQEKLAQKSAELQALQAQINPHFLYNTLDSINWMLIDRGASDISEIVISLGSLMRYSIEDDSAFVTLERETEYVLSYLMIQKNRLEDRLSYQVDLDDSVRHEKIPKLILQPLIENAINHGIEPLKHPGNITVLIKDNGDEIAISIEDDGVGMSFEQLSRLQEGLPETEKEGYSQIGVRNVDRRIRLHYGSQYFLRIASEINQGTTIRLQIPKVVPSHLEQHKEEGDS